MERLLIYPKHIRICVTSGLGAGNAKKFLEEDMKSGGVLRHASANLARNLRDRRFSVIVPKGNASGSPSVSFNQPLPEVTSEPLEPVVRTEALPDCATIATDSQAAPSVEPMAESAPSLSDATPVSLWQFIDG